jgi:hypothetical protein
MDDNTEVRSPGRDGPKKGVRDELVDSSKPHRKGHLQDDSADGFVGGLWNSNPEPSDQVLAIEVAQARIDVP